MTAEYLKRASKRATRGEEDGREIIGQLLRKDHGWRRHDAKPTGVLVHCVLFRIPRVLENGELPRPLNDPTTTLAQRWIRYARARRTTAGSLHSPCRETRS
jgi:hypothetical protein